MGKHFIPQEYLRGFATDTERKFVWMFDKKFKKWSRPAIGQAAQQRDYFDPETEEKLNKLAEGPGNRTLAKLWLYISRSC